MAIEKYQQDQEDFIIDNSNRLISNIKKLIKRQEQDIADRKGERKSQKVLSSNIKEMVRQQKESNRIQLRTMFSKKESGFDILKEELINTNTILKNLRINGDEGASFGNIFGSFINKLKDPKFLALLGAGIGASILAVYKDDLPKLYKDIFKTGKTILSPITNIPKTVQAANEYLKEYKKVEKNRRSFLKETRKLQEKRDEKKYKKNEITPDELRQAKRDLKALEEINRILTQQADPMTEFIQTVPLIGRFADNVKTGQKAINAINNQSLKYLFENKGKLMDEDIVKLLEQERLRLAEQIGTRRKLGTGENDKPVRKKLKSLAVDLEDNNISKNIKINLDQNFVNEVRKMSSRLGIPVSTLMGIMDFETGGSFDPAKRAAASSGVGLIQFISKTAKGLGTSSEELKQMSQIEQLKYVEKYFKEQMKRSKIDTLSDAYMAVLNPSKIGKAEDAPVFKRGTEEYAANAPLDFNEDGIITKKEASNKVANRAKKYISLEQNDVANAPLGEIKINTNTLESKIDRLISVTENGLGNVGKDVANNIPKPKAPQFIVSNDARR